MWVKKKFNKLVPTAKELQTSEYHRNSKRPCLLALWLYTGAATSCKGPIKRTETRPDGRLPHRTGFSLRISTATRSWTNKRWQATNRAVTRAHDTLFLPDVSFDVTSEISNQQPRKNSYSRCPLHAMITNVPI